MVELALIRPVDVSSRCVVAADEVAGESSTQIFGSECFDVLPFWLAEAIDIGETAKANPIRPGFDSVHDRAEMSPP